MLKIFVTVLLLVACGLAAKADGQNCDEKCRAYKNAIRRPLVKTDIWLVCIKLSQAQEDKVVIRFYDEAGRELDANNPNHAKVKQPSDTFCVGRHYLVKAQKGKAELCNSVKMKILTPAHINVLLRSGMPKNTAVQLFAT